MKSLVIVAGRKKRGDIHPFDAGPFFQQDASVIGTLIFPLYPGIRHLHDYLFAVAHHEGIEKISNGLRVAGTRAASDDHRLGVVPVGGEKRDACQIKYGQNIGKI